MNFSPNCNRAVSEQRGIDCITFLAENREAFIVMIILITGASHTGKTVLAQKMLEKYKYPYLSIGRCAYGVLVAYCPGDGKDSSRKQAESYCGGLLYPV